jgi:putative intracellular protease/amidase
VLLAGGVMLAGVLGGAAWIAQPWESADPDAVAEAPGPAPPPIVGHAATIANGGPGRVLLFIPADYFYDDHFTAVTTAMQDRDVEWVVASSRPGVANPKHGRIPPVPIDFSLAELEFDPNDYDGVVFIGGNVTHEFGNKHPNAQQIIRRTLETCLENDRFAAAVGDGVQAISDCKLLDGATCESQGAVWVYDQPEWSGTIFKAVDPTRTGELVDLILQPAQQSRG